jgi:DNA-binding response OmpR family regulator
VNPYIKPGIETDKVKILIVEDVPMTLHLLKSLLSCYTFQLQTASDQTEAMSCIEHDTPHLLLLDTVLFDVETLGLIQHLRAHEETRHLPIILMASCHENDKITRALELGANAYVCKPFVVDHLYRTIADQINSLF